MPHNLKIRQARERANASRFTMKLDGFEDSTPLDDIVHYCGRSKQTLDRLFYWTILFVFFCRTKSTKKI